MSRLGGHVSDTPWKDLRHDIAEVIRAAGRRIRAWLPSRKEADR